MSTPTSFVKLTVSLPARDYAAYTEAIRLLTRIMGKKTPDALALVTHTLRCRDGQGLAEDYLESIQWPMKSPAVSTRVEKVHNTRVLRQAGFDTSSDPSQN